MPLRQCVTANKHKLLLGCFGCAVTLIAIVALAWAVTHCIPEPGPPGAPGPRGGVGPAGGPTTIFLTRTLEPAAGGGVLNYLVASGHVTPQGIETDTQAIVPQACVARSLTVFLGTPVPATAVRTIVLRVNGVGTALACAVASLAETCTSLTSIGIALVAGDLIDFETTSVPSTVGATATNMTIGWVCA